MQYAMGPYGPPQGYGAGPQMSLGGYYGKTSDNQYTVLVTPYNG
jgi:hypothetical protein